MSIGKLDNKKEHQVWILYNVLFVTGIDNSGTFQEEGGFKIEVKAFWSIRAGIKQQESRSKGWLLSPCRTLSLLRGGFASLFPAAK